MNNDENLTNIQDESTIKKNKRIKDFLFFLLAFALAVVTAFVSNT